MLARSEIVPFIMELFAKRGSEEYLGEPVSMAEHMQQTAACAVTDKASDELVAAALLHDIGHFVGDFPIDSLEKGINNLHEDSAAQFLCPYFPGSITEPIRLHVAAKRYLCTVDRGYYDQLSSASVQSLKIQGGPMTQQEVAAFKAHAYYKEAVQLRQYDDNGKVADKTIHSVNHYQALLDSLLL